MSVKRTISIDLFSSVQAQALNSCTSHFPFQACSVVIESSSAMAALNCQKSPVKQREMNMIAHAFASINQAQSVEERASLIELVRNLGVTAFHGSANPEEAEEWMRRVEKTFDILRCSDEQKVLVARFSLEESANDWLTVTEQRYIDRATITWDDFRREFYAKYVPRSYLAAKFKEFLLLEQGYMSVTEYENKFYALSRYGPSFVADETAMCEQFEAGLRKEIRMIVTAAGWTEFRGLVEAAKRVEQCMSGDKYAAAMLN